MGYSIEQEIVWNEYLGSLFNNVRISRYLEDKGVVEAKVMNGLVRCYIRPNGELIPFYYISKEFQ